MAFSLLGHTVGNGAGGSTFITGQNTTGAKLIVLALTGNSANGNIIPTDSMGNVWSCGPKFNFTAATNIIALYYCLAPITSATHAFTFPNGLSSVGVLWFSSANVPTRDQRSSSGTVTPGSITPSLNNALVITIASIGGGGGGTATAVTGGFTLLDATSNTGGVFGISQAYQIQGTAAALNPTWTGAGGSVASAMMAFLDVAPVIGTAGDVLLVAGGGGGGKGFGASGASGAGGGGGGGVLLVPLSSFPTGPQAVVVGAGGTGGATPTNGNNSSFAGNIAVGGGVGGTYVGASTPGATGGSGGGAAGSNSGSDPAGGAATAGQGSPGGSGTANATTPIGGGGGGGGEDGGWGFGTFGGKGGNGFANAYSGALAYYGGGGGGMFWQSGTAGAGGVGGGGAGNLTTGVAGATNTGGGGGGGYTAGAAGGSGIVIIRYPTGSVSASGGTITTSGGYTIHTFTANGTFQILSFNAQSAISFSVTANLARGGVSFASQSNVQLFSVADLTPGFRPPAFLLPSGYETLEDNAGSSVPGGLVWSYAAGTTTPLPTYTDVSLTILNTNPIVCDAAGRWAAWVPIGTSYKLVFETPAIPPAHGSVIRTVDGLQVLSLPSWAANPFNIANYTALGGGSWTVEAGDVLAYQFMLDGKRLILNLAITNTSIAGTVSAVKVALPAGIVSAGWPQVGPALLFDNSNSIGSPGYWQVDANTAAIYFGRADRANFAVSVNQTWIWYSGVIAIT